MLNTENYISSVSMGHMFHILKLAYLIIFGHTNTQEMHTNNLTKTDVHTHTHTQFQAWSSRFKQHNGTVWRTSILTN